MAIPVRRARVTDAHIQTRQGFNKEDLSHGFLKELKPCQPVSHVSTALVIPSLNSSALPDFERELDLAPDMIGAEKSINHFVSMISSSDDEEAHTQESTSYRKESGAVGGQLRLSWEEEAVFSGCSEGHVIFQQGNEDSENPTERPEFSEFLKRYVR